MNLESGLGFLFLGKANFGLHPTIVIRKSYLSISYQNRGYRKNLTPDAAFLANLLVNSATTSKQTAAQAGAESGLSAKPKRSCGKQWKRCTTT